MQSITVGFCLLFASGGWTILVYDLEFELVKKTPREVQGARNYRGERVGRVRKHRNRPLTLRKSPRHPSLIFSAYMSCNSLMDFSEPVFSSLKQDGYEDNKPYKKWKALLPATLV